MDMSDPDLAVSTEDALRQTAAAMRYSNTLPLWISSGLMHTLAMQPSVVQNLRLQHFTQRLTDLVPDMRASQQRFVEDTGLDRRLCTLSWEFGHEYFDPIQNAAALNYMLSNCGNENLRQVAHLAFVWPITIEEHAASTQKNYLSATSLHQAFADTMLDCLIGLVFAMGAADFVVDSDPAMLVQRTLECLKGVKDAADFLPDEQRLVILSEISMLEEILEASRSVSSLDSSVSVRRQLDNRTSPRKRNRITVKERENAMQAQELCVQQRKRDGGTIQLWEGVKERMQIPVEKMVDDGSNTKPTLTQVEDAKAKKDEGSEKKRPLIQAEDAKPTLRPYRSCFPTPQTSFSSTDSAGLFSVGRVCCASLV
ncbi:MAG: hypothetical protein KVP17_004404 [Porospora cf. gigantea B]|uniref:uncharacterized protein n=1 Tax=Porospora cf. gigantea B TaxID=2853592 RepID=UPI003571B09E|nr:MAG: hypothetical protein KVP17_004404 [Porospora cf. gigantea B]